MRKNLQELVVVNCFDAGNAYLDRMQHANGCTAPANFDSLRSAGPTRSLYIALVAATFLIVMALMPREAISQQKEPSINGPYLLLKLKHLADNVDLFNPNEVAKALDLTMKESEGDINYNCKPPPEDRDKTLWKTFTPQASTVQMRGAPGVTFSASAKKSLFEIYPNSFIYEIEQHTMCEGINDIDYFEATITFNELPTLACITSDAIQTVLHSQNSKATEGYSMFGYSGRHNDALGVNLTFNFRFGMPCALSATLDQTEEGGFRFSRAYKKYNVCKIATEQSYCSLRLSPKPRVKIDLYQAEQFAQRKCIGLRYYYNREPIRGESILFFPKRRFPPICLQSSALP